MYPFKFNMGQRVQSDVPNKHFNQGFIPQLHWSALEAVASDTNGIHDTITLTTAKDVTTAITNPATPRNLTISPTKAGVTLTGDVVITGTNILDEVIEETFALNDDTVLVGTKAFKTVTKIHVPDKVTTGDVLIVGWGEKLGLPYFLTRNTVLDAFLGNAKEGTAPTVATDVDEIEKNTIDLNSSLNGSVVDVYLIVHKEPA